MRAGKANGRARVSKDEDEPLLRPHASRRNAAPKTWEHRGSRSDSPQHEGVQQNRQLYSINRSAATCSPSGMVSSSAAAVLRLIVSSNFTGCSTGRSAGLVPFRMRSA